MVGLSQIVLLGVGVIAYSNVSTLHLMGGAAVLVVLFGFLFAAFVFEADRES